MLTTILVTNRNWLVNEKTVGERESKNGVNRIAIATPQTRVVGVTHRKMGKNRKKKIEHTEPSYKLNFIGDPQVNLANNQDSISYLTDVVNNLDNDRPWLVFLHGNNQTLNKNLAKARKIQEKYQVNLLVYSWPSRAYKPKFYKALIAIGKGALLGNINWLSAGGKLIKEQHKQYNDARRKAHITARSFVSSFEFLSKYLLQPLSEKNTKVNLLIHSLGHKVLKDSLIRSPESFKQFKFDNVLMHQADEFASNSLEWVAQTPVKSLANVVITDNFNDVVLAASGLSNNNFNPLKINTRIGNRRRPEQGDPRFSYMHLTEIDGISWLHDIAWDEDLPLDLTTQFANIIS